MEFKWKSLFNEIIIDIWLASLSPSLSDLSHLLSLPLIQFEGTVSGWKRPWGQVLRWGSHLSAMWTEGFRQLWRFLSFPGGQLPGPSLYQATALTPEIHTAKLLGWLAISRSRPQLFSYAKLKDEASWQLDFLPGSRAVLLRGQEVERRQGVTHSGSVSPLGSTLCPRWQSVFFFQT